MFAYRLFVVILAFRCVQGFSIYGYLPEYRYEAVDYKALAKGLTHLILFSLETGDEGEPSALDRLPANETWPSRLAAMRTANSNLEVLLCYGGYGRSDGFPRWISKKSHRATFIRRTLELLDAYDLDGVDINWEYPTTPVQWKGLGTLVLQLKRALLRRAKEAASANTATPRTVGATVTIAFYPGQEAIIADTFTPAALMALDAAHAMAYDQVPGHHAKHSFVSRAMASMSEAADKIDRKIADVVRGVRKSSGEKTMSPLEESAAQLMKLLPQPPTIPPQSVQKFTLGLPFYARCITRGDAITWGEVVDAHPDPETAASAYARALSEAGSPPVGGEAVRIGDKVYGFDGPSALAAKTRLAAQRGLGGVMIWEVGQDKWGEAVQSQRLLPYVRATVDGFISHDVGEREFEAGRDDEL